MKNNIIKKLTIVTVAVTLFTSLSFGSVSYANDDAEEVIYSSGFSDYIVDGTPNGWIKVKYLMQNKSEIPCTSSDAYTYSENNNKGLKISANMGATIKDIIPFNKIISSGKLHVSFDLKIPKNDSGSKLFVTLFNTYNNSKYSDNTTPLKDYSGQDIKDFRGFVGLHLSQFLRIPYNSEDKISISEKCQFWDTSVKTDKSVDAGVWHHYDMVVDMDNTSYDVWVDGECITLDKKGKFLTGLGKNAFKGIGFLHQDGNTTLGYYDNIFITHYNNDDSVKIVAEYLDGTTSDVRTDVAFSEYLNRVPKNGDFMITDSYSGDIVNYEVESADLRHAVLKINTDKAAKLKISFNKNSGLSGTISSKLSGKTVDIYTNIKENGTVIPVLNEINGVDYNGNNVLLDGSESVPVGTTTINVSFSTPVSFGGVQDKIYIQKADSDKKLNVNYTISEDKKSVKLDLAELMSADSEYKFIVSDAIASDENEGVFLPYTYQYVFRTSNDGGFGIFGDEIVIDEISNTAVFRANVIKSDENMYKGTIIICGYVDEIVDGKTYTKLEKVDVKKYDIETKSITSYETSPIDISGLNRVRCYINDIDTHKIQLFKEKTF